ncbi:MAG: general secretion pathway protein D [Candidatus Scalindua rubra]|uniref:General secretion pathway protein D n=1 Tax=Candidatus Scalindua rubra TaxID=1872076 RepID=A0A1E3XC99_9BACT|nr:MAG: general secretion pathway protein D [Candidatus Scalindua rubra]
MKKTILLIVIFLFAGSKVACFNKKKEGLKKMPIPHVATQKPWEIMPMEELPVTQMVEEVKEREKFYSLSVKDMKLRDVLFVFARELPEYNIVVDPDVTGRVTVDFKDLPLGKVLAVLLEPLNLEYTIEDNLLRISNPRMVTRTFEFVYSTASRTSKSTVMAVTGAVDEEGGSGASFGSVETEETVDVWVELESGIKDLLSDTGRSIINKRVGYITVTDYRSNMKRIEEYIDLFKTSVKTMIHIRAKLLEVTLKEGSEFGINWDATLKQIGFLSGKSNPLTINQDFAPALEQETGPTGESRTGDVAELFQLSIDHRDFDFVIRALETQGKVTVLSAPEISTLNGQKAILSSVTQDVFFESQQSGTGGDPLTTITAEAFTFGVYLDVTPHVDSEGMITMEVHPSVSSFIAIRTSGDASRPAIDTRETETVVTIKDGETVIIAGLMKDDIKENISKIPLLGDIPYIGKAFRRETKSNNKTELVILISPTIVGPRAKDFGTIREKYKILKKQFP